MIIRSMAHSRGFTFLELLITMALLVLGVVPVVGVLAAGVVADQRVENRAVALALAREAMEAVKANNFADVASSSRTGVMDFSGYDLAVTVSGTDPKDVTVTVYWTLNGNEQQVSLETLITNPAPEA